MLKNKKSGLLRGKFTKEEACSKMPIPLP